jgi:hypothetical protein
MADRHSLADRSPALAVLPLKQISKKGAAKRPPFFVAGDEDA